MDYFRLQQDKRYLKTPIIENLRDFVIRKNLTVLNEYKVKEKNIVFTDTDYISEYIDLIDSQLFLVSDIIKEVFLFYNKFIKFKLFCLINNRQNLYKNYYAPIFNEIDCLSDKSVANLNKSHFKKIVLKKSIIRENCIFRIENVETDIVIIRLDVAESLMRRKVNGLSLERVETE